MQPKLVLVLFILIPTLALGQEMLSLEQAIRIALEENYTIRIAERNKQITENEVTLGNAGFLPIVSATLNRSNNYNLRFTQAIRATNTDPSAPPPPPRDFSNTTNEFFNYGATINWTIFDGMGMFIAYNRLEELRLAGHEQAQVTIEGTIADISGAYYNVTQLQERVAAFTNALRISTQRLELAKAQYEVGTGSKLNYLAAQVDYNTDKSALIQQEQLLQNAKISLNQLLNRSPQTTFMVSDTIIVSEKLELASLREQVMQNNPSILLAQRSKSAAYLERRLIQSQRLPQVNVFVGYLHGNQNNQAGFLRNQKTDVINYGISAALPLFNGFNLSRQIQNARVNEDIRDLQLKDLQTRIEGELFQTYTNYQNALTLIQLEQENLKIARQNVDIALDRYRIGVATALEFREVQESAVEAESRLIAAAYAGKLAEIELLRLSSSIVE